MAYEDLAKKLAAGGGSKKRRAPPSASSGMSTPGETSDDTQEKDEAAEDPEEEKLKTPAEAEGPDDDAKGDAVNDSMSSYDDVEGSAGDELAELSGTKDKGAFKTALGQYVRACLAKYQKESE